jgi:tRNA/rRNA methyltransferase
MLDSVRVVLVRPIRPGNVGAVCRAMKNMGLSDLVVVSPACDLNHGDARGFAARSKSMLAAARVVESISAALEDCTLTFAATGKRGAHRDQAACAARDAARLAIASAATGRVAIAFGPEDRGLLQREILLFDRVLEIPAAEEYPVLNLAAAVMVICYELHQAWRESSDARPIGSTEPLASDARKQVLYDRLFTALDRVGFFSRQQTSDHLRYAIRRVFGRVEMTVNEIDVLIGMASQIHWYADQAESRRES